MNDHPELPPPNAPAQQTTDALSDPSWTQDEKPVCRILIVEDKESFRKEFLFGLRAIADPYYQLHIDEAVTIAQGKELLLAASANVPYDGAILDYRLPPVTISDDPIRSFQLAKHCIYGKPKPAHWVGQLTSWADDEEVINFWPDPEMGIDFRGGLYRKKPFDLRRLAGDIFFSEIKEPLGSAWLPVELGAIESPIAYGKRSRHAPVGFNIYRYIRRLGTVWPRLDERTRRQAALLFEIQPGANPATDPPRSIGFKSFSCWSGQPPTPTSPP